MGGTNSQPPGFADTIYIYFFLDLKFCWIFLERWYDAYKIHYIGPREVWEIIETSYFYSKAYKYNKQVALRLLITLEAGIAAKWMRENLCVLESFVLKLWVSSWLVIV